LAVSHQLLKVIQNQQEHFVLDVQCPALPAAPTGKIVLTQGRVCLPGCGQGAHQLPMGRFMPRFQLELLARRALRFLELAQSQIMFRQGLAGGDHHSAGVL
jgi:hypothetical protein